MSRAEYIAYFSPEATEKPNEGLTSFLFDRYTKQKPEAKQFGEAKRATIQKRAVYHPVASKASMQEYRPQEGQGDEEM